MKKIILVSGILLISLSNLLGQWYVNQYKVRDIDSLSRDQLEESLGKSKKGLIFSGCIAGFGGVIFVIGKFVGFDKSEDPTFFEDLIGPKGMNDIAMVTGGAMVIGGAIASIVYLGRIGQIRSVSRHNYQSTGSVNISPTLLLNNYTHSYSPGLTLTFYF